MALEMNVNGPDDPLTWIGCRWTPTSVPDAFPRTERCWQACWMGTHSSVRGDTAEECWRIVDPVLQAWREGKVPMDEYAAGSDGPESWKRST